MVNGAHPSASLALGTAQWGIRYGIVNSGGQPDQAEIIRMLDLARSFGIVTLDTARAYGTSEDIIGDLGMSGDWRVVTKLDPEVYQPGMSWPEVRDRLDHSLAASRRALRQQRIDTLLLHRPDHRTVLGGAIWSALRDEQEAGGIGRIGVSVDSVGAAWPALADAEMEVIQVPASLLDLRLWRAGFFERALEAGVEVFVRSVFLQGLAFLPPERVPDRLSALREPLARVRTWASQHDTLAHCVFLAFLRDTVPATLLLGCETEAQLHDHLATWTSLAWPDIREAADLIPDLDESTLNPALWRTSSQGKMVGPAPRST